MKINMKSERGAITIYVIMAMLILTITLIALYVSITNKQISDLETAEQIKSIYEKDMNNIDVIYNNLVNQ